MGPFLPKSRGTLQTIELQNFGTSELRRAELRNFRTSELQSFGGEEHRKFRASALMVLARRLCLIANDRHRWSAHDYRDHGETLDRFGVGRHDRLGAGITAPAGGDAHAHA